MYVTPTTQTQYVVPNTKTTDSNTQEYEASAIVTPKETNENKWINQLSDDINNILSNTSSNSSLSLQSSIIKDEIEGKISQYASALMQENGDTPESELETSKLLNQYKTQLLQEYKESIENSTDNEMSAAQEAIIKVLMEENTQESNALTALLSAKSGTTQETAKTSKMDEMEEKYKDVYTPTPEKYIEGSEEYQMSKVYEAYPNYIDFRDIFKMQSEIYTNELGEKPIQLGDKLTPAQEEKQRLAWEKVYEKFGGEEAFTEMLKGSQEIMAKYPYNNLDRDGVHNATELARFQNAAVYEGLEQGKTIEEAKAYAGNLKSQFMDMSYSTVDFLETLIKAGRADPNALDWFLDQDERYYPQNKNEVDFNAPNNAVMDLREYGIEGSWEFYEIVESQQGMIAEIEKKMGQFDFMLNNENLIKEAYSKLDADAQTLGNNAGYKRMINEKYIPMMKEGLNIFKNYKIYD